MPPDKPALGADDLFADALELPAADRAAFLERSCGGDLSLRARVEALLASHDQAGAFLEMPAVSRPAPRREERPGDTIDRYKLIDRVGEGGCGIVFRADQTHPVRRRVALKVIKLGMDTRQVIARFEAERQALALMDHPGIARVLDAGSTDAGRPYFVMEFVNGVPITRYCDERRLTLEARLELFAQACLAIQHAHQKGIIHRDIKPSNILVSEHDQLATAKVIDFGVAKATQGNLEERTQLTQVDQVIGTPAYMSPEQAEAASDDIDTRTDIYSLGVLLYELLVGRPPFEIPGAGRTRFDALRRLICEVDPPRPSTRFATMHADKRNAVAESRGARPRQIAATLRGDLDWIVMRCLEKDRGRRYDTAQALADDIRRHLRHEPVLAGPPEISYRTRKFIARNRVACASAAAIAAALIVGTVIATTQAVRATRAERAARAERDTAVAAQRAEEMAREDSQRRLEQAEDLVGFMLGDFRGELKKVGRLDLLDAVGDKALAYFDSLNPRDVTDGALARQAKALTQIGEVRLDQARYADAERAFQTAYDRAAALAARRPTDADALFERAQAEFWMGFVARKRGDAMKNREWFERYRDSAVALVEIDPDKQRAKRELISGHHNLGVLDYDAGSYSSARDNLVAARRMREEALAINPGDNQQRAELAESISWLARTAEHMGNLVEAIDLYQEAMRQFTELAKSEPKNLRWRQRTAEKLTFRANVIALTGRRSESLALHSEAASIYELLSASDPSNRYWQSLTANAQLAAAWINISDEPEKVVRTIQSARSTFERLLEAEPTSSPYSRGLAFSLQLEAQLSIDTDPDNARKLTLRSITLGEKLPTGTRIDNRAAGEFARACILAGRIAAKHGDRDEARRYWLRAMNLLKPRLNESKDWRVLDPAAQALLLLNQPEEALPLLISLQKIGYHPLDAFSASLFESHKPNRKPNKN